MKVAVVGAGMSGLACAHRLQETGHEVTVYERDGQVGGRMASVTAGGFRIDTGANLLLSHYERTQLLAREVGIHDEWFSFHADGAGGILRDGKLTSFLPQGPLDVLGYEGISWISRLRLLAFLLRAKRWVGKLDFFDLSAGSDVSDGTDADTYVRSRLGSEIADWLVDPFVRTFHFHSAKQISMKYFDALATLLLGQGGFSSCGFRRNMGSLSQALASRLKVHLNTPVQTISREKSEICVDVAGQSEKFDSVVVATPATATLKLLQDQSQQQRELLHAVEYSSAIMCAFRVPNCALPPFEGIWVPFTESKIICCCANETRKGAFDETECLFLIGTHEEAAKDLIQRTDEEVYEILAAEWIRLFPQYQGCMKGLYVQRWPNALPVYAPGLIRQVTRFWESGQGEDGIWLCGDYLNHPWVEGSIQCGEKIAGRIGAALRTTAVAPGFPV